MIQARAVDARIAQTADWIVLITHPAVRIIASVAILLARALAGLAARPDRQNARFARRDSCSSRPARAGAMPGDIEHRSSATATAMRPTFFRRSHEARFVADTMSNGRIAICDGLQIDDD